ncbi:GNAT family N-acetyltransferase [Micromonospora sp. WMMA1947]|uniref:GNAT family N-acetyltransferase n=1 Tax=Micromonospora sp. WMMA1947 TaxID=3015163 RepID=UPI00248BF6A0|nr:GNAT family N-acetyltransferase [Micromonospora sp. WMMA1947]WBC10058.1 GNAT family N-acetyltransferase [Micromonospora sp. WMMA1947]
MLENLRPQHQTAAETEGLVEQLVDVYLDAHPDDGPRYTAERCEQQRAAHMPRGSWGLVTAYVDDELVGYVYGFPLGSDTRWWDGIHEPVPDGFMDEDGQRTYAVCELVVRRSWQRRGIARARHDRLLSTRREERATLLVRPDHTAAQQAYDSWGWRSAGWLQPTREGAPLFEVRTKVLTLRS